MIYVFTGKGKGKTTAALGVGLRALGANKKVLMVQFLKPGDSSEREVIEEMDNNKVGGIQVHVYPKDRNNVENNELYNYVKEYKKLVEKMDIFDIFTI